MVDLLRVHLSRGVGELREDFWGRRQHWVARAPDLPSQPLCACPKGEGGGGGGSTFRETLGSRAANYEE